jgi:phenylacetate-CoA ligase
MVKVKGVNIFPSQIDELLKSVNGASSEYQVMIDHLNGKDIVTLFVEKEADIKKTALAKQIEQLFKAQIGISVTVKPVELGDLPRSEKKSTRIYDNRY